MQTRWAEVGSLIVATALTLCSPAAVAAQRSAEASAVAPNLATDLAKRSIELLDKGEDSSEPSSKLRLYREGLELAQQAVAADDKNADAHFALFAHTGRVMVAEGATLNPLNLWRVSHELERALELNPRHPAALAAKGGMYRQLPALFGGSLKTAERCLQQSIANNPNAVGARIELARTYQDMGQPARAVELLTTASELAERLGKTRQNHEAHQLLAEIRATDSGQAKTSLPFFRK